MKNINKQLGSVSIFVVIFAALLITVVTVSFVRIMIQSQQQASIVDLSQSAYDSAQAGIEDAKRALLNYQTKCITKPDSSCASVRNNITDPSTNKPTSCNQALTDISISYTPGQEIPIQQNSSNALDQAYTCVKITLNTSDYLGKLSDGESKLIQLKGTSPFNKIQIKWFSQKDIDSNNTVDFQKDDKTPLLSEWPQNRPPIIRAQLIQFNSASGFSLGYMDNSGSANTLFLYPANITSTTRFSTDSPRRVTTGKPQSIDCSKGFISDIYACVATLVVPEMENRTAFLRLSAIYGNTNFRIILLGDGDSIVDFDGVQPKIDSTGRANNLFRRIKARVEFNADFPYPDAEINVSGDFCKDFLVTNQATDYANANLFTTTNGRNTINGCTP